MSFPERLRYLRTQKGLSREEVAKAVSKSWHSIAKWETGNRDPGTEDLALLAGFFGVTTDYLLGRVASPTDELVRETTIPLDPSIERIGDPAADEINDLLALMSPEEKEAFRRLAQSVVNRQTKGVS